MNVSAKNHSKKHAVTSTADHDVSDLAASELLRVNSGGTAIESSGMTLDGWIDPGETWVYSSADAPNFTFKIEGVDVTAKYSKGMRIRMSQSTGGTKYFVIVADPSFSTDTSVTVYGGSDYTLNNETISSPVYSPLYSPVGFPLDKAQWSERVSDTSFASQSAPVVNTKYNLGSISIDIPLGLWNTQYKANLFVRENDGQGDSLRIYSTLSKANNTEDDTDWTLLGGSSVENATGGTDDFRFVTTLYASKQLDLSAKDTYYLNAWTDIANLTNIAFQGNAVPTIIEAVCAYI